jgi:hypothetical protein
MICLFAILNYGGTPPPWFTDAFQPTRRATPERPHPGIQKQEANCGAIRRDLSGSVSRNSNPSTAVLPRRCPSLPHAHAQIIQ